MALSENGAYPQLASWIGKWGSQHFSTIKFAATKTIKVSWIRISQLFMAFKSISYPHSCHVRLPYGGFKKKMFLRPWNLFQIQSSGILATCCSSCALLEANLLTVCFRGEDCTFNRSLGGATSLRARCTVSTRRGEGAGSKASLREAGIRRKEGKNGSKASKFGEMGDSMAGVKK
jgi:hypothetical protein